MNQMYIPFFGFRLGLVYAVAWYFIFYGVWNLYQYKDLKILMSERYKIPTFVLPIGIIWQITAGLMILLNFKQKLAAFSLIPFTLIAVSFFHLAWYHSRHIYKLSFPVFLANIIFSLGALLSLMYPLNAVVTKC